MLAEWMEFLLVVRMVEYLADMTVEMMEYSLVDHLVVKSVDMLAIQWVGL